MGLDGTNLLPLLRVAANTITVVSNCALELFISRTLTCQHDTVRYNNNNNNRHYHHSFKAHNGNELSAI